MVLNAEQKCLLWLSAAEVTPGHLQTLKEQWPTAQAIWDDFGKPEGPRFHPAVEKVLTQYHSREALDALVERLDSKNVHLLFREDEAYPEQLAAIADPPYLLYYAGRLSCLQKPMVAIVGTRRASGYGREMASILARGLCDAGACVVSGLARGIDEAAHQAALDAGGSTLAFLAAASTRPIRRSIRPCFARLQEESDWSLANIR